MNRFRQRRTANFAMCFIVSTWLGTLIFQHNHQGAIQAVTLGVYGGIAAIAIDYIWSRF